MTTYQMYSKANGHFVESNFELVESVQQTRTRDGGGQVVVIGGGLWRATYKTIPLTVDHVIGWQTWWQKLRAGLHSFQAVTVHQRYPQAYVNFNGLTRAGGGSFDGIGSINAVTETTVTVGNLPAAFVVTAGDFVMLYGAGIRGLFRIIADVVASAGGVATLAVVPGINTELFTTADQATFADPNCRAVPVPGSFSGSLAGGLNAVSFQGIQRVY